MFCIRRLFVIKRILFFFLSIYSLSFSIDEIDIEKRREEQQNFDKLIKSQNFERKEPSIERGYKVPAVNIVSGIGFISCALAFVMSFIPTTSEAAIPRNMYPIVVAIVVFLLGIPPFIFYMFKKPSWDMRTAQEKEEKPIH